MRLRKNIATSEEGLIFNPGSGDSFSVNNTGNEILSMLKQNKSGKEIVDHICEKYEVERIQVEKDMDNFFSQLTDYNLLEK